MKTALLPLVFCTVLFAGCSKAPTGVSAPATVAVAEVPGDLLCRAELKTFVKFNDPESVRINSVAPNPDRPGRFLMSVSAKNAMGGYGNLVNCTCGTAKQAVTDMHCDGPGT